MGIRLQRLPRSITGLFDKEGPFRSVDARSFKSACHVVTQMEGGSVEAFRSDLLLRNYYSAWLITRAERVLILCNATYPYVAFSPLAESTWRDRIFVAPVFQAAFETLTDFQPLDADWLMSDVTRDMLAALPPWEVKHVRYWEPDHVGSVIFNEWG